MTWTVGAVSREGALVLWPVVAPLLAPAIELASSRMSMRTVRDWLEDGRYVLWVAHADDRVIKAAFLTREAQYPLRRMLTIDGCGGSDMQGWLQAASDAFRSHSRAAGLDGVEMYGRTGWARALRQLGWRATTVMAELDN